MKLKLYEMDFRACQTLKSLLYQNQTADAETLLGYLSAAEQTMCQQQTVLPSCPAAALIELPKFILSHIHYSWFVPLFQHYSPAYHPYFAACLTAEKKKGVERLMHIQWKDRTLSAHAQNYFNRKLYLALSHEKPLPIEWFPFSELNGLCALTKIELIYLIDLLAMHDIAAELPAIADAKRLNHIHNLLSANQKKYLKYCLRTKSPLRLSPIGLAQWQKPVEDLKRALHHRGICRLGWALAQEHTSLLWYLSRTLDIGRGMLLQCAVFSDREKWAAQTFKDEVIRLIKIFSHTQQKDEI